MKIKLKLIEANNVSFGVAFSHQVRSKVSGMRGSLRNESDQ